VACIIASPLMYILGRGGSGCAGAASFLGFFLAAAGFGAAASFLAALQQKNEETVVKSE
jgi:Pyruvate/2-oxoacid:ferredoxin oxidoreductase gamma subunit